jgi:hypothetical protein
VKKDNYFIWDEKETRLIRFSFIRNFTLEPDDNCVKVIGWFSDSESFHLKTCTNFAEAQTFLKNIEKGEEL